MRVRCLLLLITFLTILGLCVMGCKRWGFRQPQAYSVNLSFEGVVGFVRAKDPKTGAPLVWALLPKVDENRAGRLDIPGPAPRRTVAAHHSFVVIDAKNVVPDGSTTCSGNGQSPQGHRIFLSLAANIADDPKPDDKKGHDVEISPLLGSFHEGAVTFLDQGSVPDFGKLGLSSDEAKVKPEFLGDRAGIGGDEIAARIVLSQGTLQPAPLHIGTGVFRYGTYDPPSGDFKLKTGSGSSFNKLAAKIMVVLTYDQQPLSLRLQLLGPGGGTAPATQNFLLCPAPNESNLNIQVVNMPLADEFGVPGPPLPFPNRIEHFLLFYNLALKKADLRPIPVIERCEGCGGQPFCTHAILTQ